MHDVLPCPTDEAEAFISLSDVLSEHNSRLSRQKRFKLATVLASSLLQLQTTPWLIGSFEKRNIFFYRHGEDMTLDHPYLRHSFPGPSTGCKPTTIQPQSDLDFRIAARASLDNLGILLLELCFGQPIETQKLREKHLVEGKPHQGTDMMTARDLADTNMLWEEDPMLESIVRSCLFPPFEDKPDWRNKLFTQAVYSSVVGPLDHYFVSKWP